MISVCMIVQDEEECIERCLDSINEYVDEIVIVDGGSIDKTIELVSRYPKAKIYPIPFNKNYSEQRNRSIELATNEWVFVADADEYFYPYIMSALKRLIMDFPEHDAFAFPRKTIVDGTFHNIVNPDFQTRLFKNYCYYEGIMHEGVVGFNNLCYTNMEIIHDKKSAWQLKDENIYQEIGFASFPGWEMIDGKWVHNG